MPPSACPLYATAQAKPFPPRYTSLSSEKRRQAIWLHNGKKVHDDGGDKPLSSGACPVARHGIADALRRHKPDPDRFPFRPDRVHKSRAVAETPAGRVYTPVIPVLPDTEITVKRILLLLLRF